MAQLSITSPTKMALSTHANDEELIDDDVEGLQDSPEGKSRFKKVQRLKPGTTDIVNLVQTPEEIPREVILPVPKSGASPLDIRISSEVTPDLPIKEEAWQPEQNSPPDS